MGHHPRELGRPGLRAGPTLAAVSPGLHGAQPALHPPDGPSASRPVPSRGQSVPAQGRKAAAAGRGWKAPGAGLTPGRGLDRALGPARPGGRFCGPGRGRCFSSPPAGVGACAGHPPPGPAGHTHSLWFKSTLLLFLRLLLSTKKKMACQTFFFFFQENRPQRTVYYTDLQTWGERSEGAAAAGLCEGLPVLLPGPGSAALPSEMSGSLLPACPAPLQAAAYPR